MVMKSIKVGYPADVEREKSVQNLRNSHFEEPEEAGKWFLDF
jgi:hypothetical protein